MLRTNPCICHAREDRFDASMEFERGMCHRCGRFLPWALDEVWEDGLGIRALSLAVDEARLVLRAAAVADGVEPDDLDGYADWLAREGEFVDIVKGIKAARKAGEVVIA